jgi:cold shock CspA family protein
MDSMNQYDSRLLRIGIFYDGNYFYHVSNYYCYAHPRRARLSIPGVHDFIKRLVSEYEGADHKFCQIVDCHYFRGRLPAIEAEARRILLNERVFDDILMREGVVTHYLPMSRQGGEKGVDVSLSLEALELTIFKKFNVVVLIACDGDYVPLVRKLNSIGTRVMVLGWDFEYMDDNGNSRVTMTSARLMNEVTYPVWMHKLIDDREKRGDKTVGDLFVPPPHERNAPPPSQPPLIRPAAPFQPEPPLPPVNFGNLPADDLHQPGDANGNLILPPGAPKRLTGSVVQMKNGYGFISRENPPGKNLFFFWEDVEGVDFNDLCEGDLLEYELGVNERGDCARHVRLLEQAGGR